MEIDRFATRDLASLRDFMARPPSKHCSNIGSIWISVALLLQRHSQEPCLGLGCQAPSGTGRMSTVIHSITIIGHDTSVSLEDNFWEALKEIAKERGTFFRGPCRKH
jgi:hypothetical protein